MCRLRSGAVPVALPAAVSLAAPAPARATAVFFGITPVSNELVRLDTATGAGSHDQRADRLRELDPADGHTLASIDIGAGNLSGEGAVELGEDGVGWVAEARFGPGRLWTFDLGAGTATLVTGQLTPSFDGLTLEPGTGTLFGISTLSLGLYTIDPDTGATTVISAANAVSGPGLGGIAGLAFGADDALWLAAVGKVYSVDKVQGTLTLVGPTGFDVSGLAFVDVPGEPIPEPATMLLLGEGSSAWAGARGGESTDSVELALDVPGLA